MSMIASKVGSCFEHEQARQMLRGRSQTGLRCIRYSKAWSGRRKTITSLSSIAGVSMTSFAQAPVLASP
jgi:hypothetical protein